jgi:DNA-binding NarL/FixJ family response regulator
MKKNLTVMFIDDSESDRVLFRHVLKFIDDTIEYITAIDGKDGLDYLISAAAKIPDYIFVDINMPRVNGIEFLEKIKAIEQLAGIPVILYSTAAPWIYEEKATRLGASHCLAKSMGFDETCQAIASIIVHHPQEK